MPEYQSNKIKYTLIKLMQTIIALKILTAILTISFHKLISISPVESNKGKRTMDNSLRVTRSLTTVNRPTLLIIPIASK